MISPQTEALWRMMLGLLLYRLGGQQTFTPSEIDEIRKTVQGVTIFAGDNDSIVLRTRGPEAVQQAIEEKNVI